MTRALILCAVIAFLGCQTTGHVPPEAPQLLRCDSNAEIRSPSSDDGATLLDGVSSASQPETRGNTVHAICTQGMVEVPAGTAVLGSTKDEAKRALELCKDDPMSTRDSCKIDHERETPRREVFIGRFWIGQHEVTVGEYEVCMGEGVCTSPAMTGVLCNRNTHIQGLPHNPINCVTWQQADSYCQWRRQRLPTADEWEKAARGSTGQTFPWGEDLPGCEHGYGQRGGCAAWVTLEEDTAQVGSFPLDRSPFGVMDMAGNVSEWTGTAFEDGYRIIKGGGAYSSPAELRGANFMFADEKDADVFIGFRCAYSEEEEAPAPGP